MALVVCVVRSTTSWKRATTIPSPEELQGSEHFLHLGVLMGLPLLAEENDKLVSLKLAFVCISSSSSGSCT